jgi:acyl-CoA synthetase (AMP-forming)/AMP-acid ligase II
MLTAATLGELLAAAAQSDAAASAFRYGDARVSYGDWDALASRVAGGLAAAGVRRGDVVALLLPTTPLYMMCYLGAARLGAVTTGINVRYRRTEIGHILRRSGATLLLAVERWHDADFRRIVEDIAHTLPELRESRWVSSARLREGTPRALDALGLDGTAPVDGPGPDDPAAIVWTSGTTGVPKGAWYAHRSLMALAAIESRRHPDGTPRGERHLASGLSFAHVGAMARIAIQLGTMSEMIIYDTFETATVLEAIERERIVNLGAFPTQAIMLLDHPDRPRRDLSSLRSILLGGAPSSPALIRRVQETFGARAAVRYSSTEVGIATGSLPDDPIDVLATTVGKPTPGVELRIVDGEKRPLPANEIGQVIVRSPATMRGYWRDPDATAATMDAEGWVHTGDLGWLDDDGYLHLRGRQSEMFIRGGFNVYPGEIEDLLARHPKIARAAVVGLPDDVFGEVGWAFVVPRTASDAPSLAELRAYVGAELASFKRPDGLTLLDDLPLTPMFKVDKQVLKARGRG